MPNILVSFIIPAYNASKTIKRAINSILNQKTNIQYEIIVVDDGSNDDLEKTIEFYKKEKKVKYFKKKNEGVSSARNYGVSKAKGCYIIFVDSDDYISENLLEDIKLYLNDGVNLIKWQANIVEELETLNELKKVEEYKTLKNLEQRTHDKKNNNTKTKEITGEVAFNKLYGTDYLICCLWNYAIKKENILKFPENRLHEDFAVMPLIILSCKRVIILDKKEYYYVQTKKSIMRGSSREKEKKKLEDILFNFDNLIKQSKKSEVNIITKENLAIFAVNSILAKLNDISSENKEYYVNELKKRKIYKYIKGRNLKQVLKRLYLQIKFL